MRLLLLFGVCATLAFAGQQSAPTPQEPETQNSTQTQPATEKTSITIPAGTTVVLAMTSPVWSKSVNVGDQVYAVSDFPVAVDNQIAVPPGTYVEGAIDSVTQPTRKTNAAQFQMHFAKLIFANGYTVLLAENPPAASATVNVKVSYLSDILLDVGSQFEMTVQVPLTLDSASVADAALRSKAPPIGPIKSATRCQPVPGTPGTSDTIIPGTPGTPSTTVPGGPGMPDITIPGTPGTPATIIPGNPGTPGIYCPGPPIVMSGPLVPTAPPDDHVAYAKLAVPVQVDGSKLPAGMYQIAWTGNGPTASVKVSQKGKLVRTLQAHVVSLKTKPQDTEISMRTASDGEQLLDSISFRGQMLQLVFDQ
jgi:hypothetical protein